MNQKLINTENTATVITSDNLMRKVVGKVVTVHKL